MNITRDTLRRSWRAWSSDAEPLVGPAWLQWVWTGLFAMVVALGFAGVGLVFVPEGRLAQASPSALMIWYGKNLLISACVAYTIHGLFALVHWRVGRQRTAALTGWRQVAFYAGIPLLGTAIGWPVGLWLALGEAPWLLFVAPGNTRLLTMSLILSLVLTAVSYQYFNLKAQRIDAERRATEAQLRLLQGQMEPHFLFNTLANVLSLMDTQPAKARVMLESFVDYLRSSLGGLRTQQHTLGDELLLVQAYLRIVALRMEDRLRVEMDVPEHLLGVPMPPLLLQPLVENAIVHGLEPALDGGVLRLHAQREGGMLAVTVQDDGQGLDAAASVRRQGTGTALNNLRARLSQAFGDQASLTVATAAPRGTVVRVMWPVRAAVVSGHDPAVSAAWRAAS